MNVDLLTANACARVPGLQRGALVLLPDGYVLGAAGEGRLMDLEPLTRSTVRCLKAPSPYVEYLFVIEDQLVVVQRGRRDARLALVVTTSTEHNVAFVLGASRLAMSEVEESVDLTRWGL